MKTVRINGRDFKVRNTLRAIFIFEQITGKGFEIKTTLDNFLFLYSVVLACNPEETLSWDEFIDALDSDPKLTEDINGILKAGEETERLLSGEGDGDEGDEKKN